MIVYADTSALVKLVFEEAGSDLAAELWDRADLVASSQLSYPEARATAASAHRKGRIDSRTLRRAVERIDGLCVELEVIGVDQALAHAAGDLAQAHGLRGYDAVHLASALSIEAESLLLATWDGELARAALASGCSVSPRPAR